MFHRIVLAVLVFAGASPLTAVGDLLWTFEDHDLTTWQFTEPPSSPRVELIHFAYDNSYLTVRQSHRAGQTSQLSSYQAATGAVFAPVVLGAASSFTISGRFRMFFEGEEPSYYATRSLSVRALIVQGNEVFLSRQPIYVWSGSEPLQVWSSAELTALAEQDFVSPDGSSEPNFFGLPMQIGFAVNSGFESSTVGDLEHRFEVDFDDFLTTAEAPAGEPLPRLSFFTDGALMQTTCGAVAVHHSESHFLPGKSHIEVRLSELANGDRPYRMLQNGLEFSSSETPLEIRDETDSMNIAVDVAPLAVKADLFQLVSVEGGTIGEPSRLALLIKIDEDYPNQPCPFVVLAYWRSDLRQQGCEMVVGKTGIAPSLSEAPSGIPELPPGVAELQALRDQVMATTAAGRYYAALYKTLSPAILRTIIAHPGLLVDLFLSEDAWIDALATLTEGGASTTRVSADMAADLNRLLDGFEANGSPALRRTIAHERARLGLSTISGLTMNQFWQRVNDRWDPEPCVADGYGLCLGGGRYRVESDWATPAGASGRGRAAALSGDSGYFWFFDPANVEILTKIVDGCGFNQRIWSYSAGLTNLEVELSVFDTATGRGKTYDNPLAASFAPILDGDFLECVAGLPIGEPAVAETVAEPPAPEVLPYGSCLSGPQTLCLGDGRFRVEADWRTAAGATGAAHAVPLSTDTGTFWFFNAANIELVVKSIDACGLAGFENFWLFAGGTTDVEVTLRVTDTLRNVSKTYHRPLGRPFAPILDTAGFHTCP